jgi:hypothetical protein
MAALTLLHSACKKKKEMLRKTMNLLLFIIQTPGINHSQKDMIGNIADGLQGADGEVPCGDRHPGVQSPHGHLRARTR